LLLLYIIIIIVIVIITNDGYKKPSAVAEKPRDASYYFEMSLLVKIQ